jgi:hypothetical protein
MRARTTIFISSVQNTGWTLLSFELIETYRKNKPAWQLKKCMRLFLLISAI